MEVEDEPAPTRFIIEFVPTSPARDSNTAAASVATDGARAIGARARFERRLATDAALVSLDRNPTAEEASRFMDEVAADPAVRRVQPDLRVRPTLIPDDIEWPDQWHYFEPTGGIELPAALDVADGSGIKVAVLDTGTTGHPDLMANTVGGYDFIAASGTAGDGDGRDSNPADEGDWATAGQCGVGEPAEDSSWHGTHVQGTIAAVTNNALGVAGVAPAAQVVPVRVLGHCGGSFSDIIDAIVWAAGGPVDGVPANPNPAQVINMSLGGLGACGSLQAAIDTAVGLGAVVVVSAGNKNADASAYAPANCSNSITVAATDRSGGKASYSNFGAVIEIAAPGGGAGGGVRSTLNTGLTTPVAPSYASYQGTSMAAPHVAGVAALVLGQEAMTPAALAAHLVDRARAFPGICDQCGAGIVSAAAAVVEAPAAADDDYHSVSDQLLTVDAPGVLANDVDFQHQSMTAELVTPPAGDVSLQPDGSFTYTSPPGFLGTDSFTYAASDGTNVGLPATVSIVVDLRSVFVNAGAIDIPENASASPYPSTIEVSTPPGATVADLDVRLEGLFHTYVQDVDVLLVGPDGVRSALILSDVGGTNDVFDIDITLDDDAPTTVPTPMASGDFRPTDVDDLEGSDAFASPAPQTVDVAALSGFDGIDPNGTWSLYVVDDFPTADSGQIAGGWSLRFALSTPPAEPTVGLLRATTSPALPSQIIVDGVIADSWGLTWLELPPGSHTVAFTHVEGYTEPAPQTVEVVAGATTTVVGTFSQRGSLKVETSPALPGMIAVDGVPRNNWGMWTDIPVGSHEVCFGPVAGFAPPPCETVNVTSGVLTTVIGAYPP